MKRVIVLLSIMALLAMTVTLFAQVQAKQVIKPTPKPALADKPAPAQKPVAQTELTGYLSDVKCGTAGKDTAKNDLTKDPGKHTVSCMKAPDCAASGYGIFIKGDKGLYTFHKFDANGNKLTATILKKCKQKDNLKVTVKGSVSKSGVVSVNGLDYALKPLPVKPKLPKNVVKPTQAPAPTKK